MAFRLSAYPLAHHLSGITVKGAFLRRFLPGNFFLIASTRTSGALILLLFFVARRLP